MTIEVSSPTFSPMSPPDVTMGQQVAVFCRKDLSAQDARVLEHLSGPDHVGRTDLVEGMVSLIGKRGGISLVMAQVAIGQMDSLVQSGHLVRQGQGDRLIYTLARRAVLSAIEPQAAATTDLGTKRVVSGKSRIKRRTGQDHPLLWLASRKDKAGQALISAVALAAGERLQRDFLQAGMSPKMTADWSGLPMSGTGRKSGHLLQTESQIAARQRLRRALAACGHDYANLLLDLCCFHKPLEMVEKQRGWPARSGKVVLGMALAALMRHYGLSEVAHGQEPSGKRQGTIRVWHAPEPTGC